MPKASARQRLELTGATIAPGLTFGKAHLLRQISLDALEKTMFPVRDVAAEILRLESAVSQTRSQIEQLRAQAPAENGRDLAGILDAQLALLEDADLLDKIRNTIRTQAVNTEYLIANEIRRIEKEFRNLKDEVMRSRFLDVQDVQHRLLRNLLEIEHVRTNPFRRLTTPVVLVADRMLPSDIALLDLDKILGIIIEEGSRVSHVAIIAKSLGIPALTEVSGAATRIHPGDTVLFHADAGRVIVHPDGNDLAWYEKARKTRPLTAHASRQPAQAHEPCQTRDGTRITLEANIGALREVKEALAAGADGIGLLRSEFFYMSCPELPSLEAETAFYRDVLHAMRKRPVTIRLLDIGADKPLSCLPLPKEENPQLGIRGVRLLLRTPELLRRHLLAILRASESGPVRILLPFIATMRDLERILAVVEELCRQEHIPRKRFHVGIMVETPAVAMNPDPFLNRADFLSIGTNDLVQYMFAASREERQLEEYRQAYHPVILRLIHAVVGAARAHGKPASVCGEMASDPAMALLLIGLGIRTLSLQANALAPVRATIRLHSMATVEKLAHDALEMERSEQVLALLEKIRAE
ncbi:MAG: phosphoenolpyruvate--protein phosphotransferase [bacterium]